MAQKILLVEDDPCFGSVLKSYLELSDYEVTLCVNGNDGLEAFRKDKFDICLLDVMMPEMDGFTLGKKIREIDGNVPFVYITAKSMKEDMKQGYEIGADDYIVKPFSLVELDARVRAHLRREARHNFEAQVKFSGDLTIDYSERCLFFGDKRVGLAKREFDIVELLSQNPGQIFDKERIYERIWGYDSEGDSSVVAEHIRRIRTKIAAYTDHIYVETVWGCGYKWVK